MKRILKNFCLNLFSVYLVMQLVSGIYLADGLKTLLLVSAGLTAAALVIKPVLNVLLLPLNLLTFGVFRWISSAISLYLITTIVPGFTADKFDFAGWSTNWFDFPALHITGILALILFSLVIAVISSCLHWLFK